MKVDGVNEKSRRYVEKENKKEREKKKKQKDTVYNKNKKTLPFRI